MRWWFFIMLDFMLLLNLNSESFVWTVCTILTYVNSISIRKIQWTPTYIQHCFRITSKAKTRALLRLLDEVMGLLCLLLLPFVLLYIALVCKVALYILLSCCGEHLAVCTDRKVWLNKRRGRAIQMCGKVRVAHTHSTMPCMGDEIVRLAPY